MKPLGMKDLSRIGFVHKAHGFHGELLCSSEGIGRKKLQSLKFVFILLEGLPVPYAVESLVMRGDENFVLKLEDVGTEREALLLARHDLYALKIRQTGSQSQEFGWEDLAGYIATDISHGELGRIEEVREYPMQWIARCIVNGREILFPLNENIVRSVDAGSKTVTVDLPPGLVDVYLG